MPNGWVFSEPSVEMAQCPTVVLIAPLVDSLVESGKRLANDSPVSDIEATDATTATRTAIRFGTLWIVFPISFYPLCLHQMAAIVSNTIHENKRPNATRETMGNKSE